MKEKPLLLFSFLSFICIFSYGQISSVTDGNWNDPGTWDSGTVPSSSDGTITVDHFVSIPSSFNAIVDEVTINGALVVEAGGTLTVQNGSGDDLNISGGGLLYSEGTIINEDAATIVGSNEGNTFFASGSLFSWRYTATEGQIPVAEWEPNSTLEVIGYTTLTSLASPNWQQPFGNLTWNCPSATASVNWNGLINQVDGNLTIVVNGGNLRTITLASAPHALTVAGNLSVSGSGRINAFNSAVTIGGSFAYSATSSLRSTFGATNLTIGDDLTINPTSGGLSFSSSNIYCGGDFTLTSGTIVGSGTFHFSTGTSVHAFVNTGSITGTINYTVGTGHTLDVSTYPLQAGVGLGTFTLNGTLRVGSTDANGAIQNNQTGGNVRTLNRTYGSGSTIVYNGLAAQFLGSGHPSAAGVNTVTNNSSGVTLATNVTIDGNLTLTQGNLNVNSTSFPVSLTLGGTVTANGNAIAFSGSQSDLVINGSGNFGTFPFPAGNVTIQNLTINRTGDVVFNNPVTITGLASLVAGNLVFSNQSLSLNGTFSATSGTLYSNAASTLTLGGNGGNLGTVVFNGSGNVLHTLTMNRVGGGTATLNSTITVQSGLNLTAGSLTNASVLNLANGATIARNGTGELLGNRPANNPGESFNVTYVGGTALNTSLELPDPSNAEDLNDLTVDGGPVTLNQNVIVNGTLTLVSNTLNLGSNILTMEGSAWNDNAGNISGGTVVFNGTTTVGGSSDPAFNNIQLNAGRSLTFPSGNVNISGDIQFTAGSSFNAGGGTITMNSSALQNIAAGGATFHNLVLNKGGDSDVNISNPLVLTRQLTISSANTDLASNGNLTLRSTSDQTSGTAQIGPLLNGATVSGSVRVERFVSDEGRMYRYVSSPVTNATVADLLDDFPVTGSFPETSGCSSCTTNPSLYFYNGATSAYVAHPTSSATEALTPGFGYAAYNYQNSVIGPITIDYNGPVNQGTIALSVAFNGAAAESWNLVGNPYPSTVNWDNASGWSRTNISSTIAVRDNAMGMHLYWDGATGSLGNGNIALGQAFWARATAGGPSLSINENAKTLETGVFHREPTKVDVLMVRVEKGNVFDQAFVRLRPDAENGSDIHDGPKLSNDFLNLSSLSADGKPMAINALKELACNDQIQLELQFPKRNGNFAMNPEGEYNLSIDQIGIVDEYEVTLVDGYTNSQTLLRPGAAHSFRITSDPASYDAKRFKLALSTTGLEVVSQINTPAAICAGATGDIELDNTQQGWTYHLVMGENVMSQQGGSALTFQVRGDDLLEDTTAYQVKAENFCGQVISLKEGVLTKVSMPEPEFYADPLCQSGSVSIHVKNPCDDCTYTLYDHTAATVPMTTSTNGTLVAPAIQEATTFYAGYRLNNGCESARVAVVASVTTMEPAMIENVEGTKLRSNYADGNQWFYNDEAIADANEQEFIPVLPGTYSVRIQKEQCETTASYVYTSGEVAYVYPNPVVDKLNLIVSDADYAKEAMIIASSGNEIRTASLNTSSDNKYFAEAQVGDLTPGIYFVKLRVGGRTITLKFLKIK